MRVVALGFGLVMAGVALPATAQTLNDLVPLGRQLLGGQQQQPQRPDADAERRAYEQGRRDQANQQGYGGNPNYNGNRYPNGNNGYPPNNNYQGNGYNPYQR